MPPKTFRPQQQPRKIDELDENEELEFSSDDEFQELPPLDFQKLFFDKNQNQSNNVNDRDGDSDFSLDQEDDDDDEEEDASEENEDGDNFPTTTTNFGKVKLPLSPSSATSQQQDKTKVRDPFFAIENEQMKRSKRMEQLLSVSTNSNDVKSKINNKFVQPLSEEQLMMRRRQTSTTSFGTTASNNSHHNNYDRSNANENASGHDETESQFSEAGTESTTAGTSSSVYSQSNKMKNNSVFSGEAAYPPPPPPLSPFTAPMTSTTKNGKKETRDHNIKKSTTEVQPYDFVNSAKNHQRVSPVSVMSGTSGQKRIARPKTVSKNNNNNSDDDDDELSGTITKPEENSQTLEPQKLQGNEESKNKNQRENENRETKSKKRKRAHVFDDTYDHEDDDKKKESSSFLASSESTRDHNDTQILNTNKKNDNADEEDPLDINQRSPSRLGAVTSQFTYLKNALVLRNIRRFFNFVASSFRTSSVGQKMRWIDDTALYVAALFTFCLSVLILVVIAHRTMKHQSQYEELKIVEDRIEKFRQVVDLYEEEWKATTTAGKKNSGHDENSNDASILSYFYQLVFGNNRKNNADDNNNQNDDDDKGKNNLKELLEKNPPDSSDFLRFTPFDVNAGLELEETSLAHLTKYEKYFDLTPENMNNYFSSDALADDYYYFFHDQGSVFDHDGKSKKSHQVKRNQKRNTNQNEEKKFSSSNSMISESVKQISLMQKMLPQKATDHAEFFVSVSFSGRQQQQQKQNSNKKDQEDNLVPVLAQDLQELKKDFFLQQDVSSKLSFTVPNVITSEDASNKDIRVFVGVEEADSYFYSSGGISSINNDASSSKNKKDVENDEPDKKQENTNDKIPLVHAAPVASKSYRNVILREHILASEGNTDDDNDVLRNSQKGQNKPGTGQHVKKNRNNNKAPLSSSSVSSANERDPHQHHHHHGRKRTDNAAHNDQEVLNSLYNQEDYKSWSDSLYLCHVCVMVKLIKHDDQKNRDAVDHASTKKANFHFELVSLQEQKNQMKQILGIRQQRQDDDDDSVFHRHVAEEQETRQVSSCHYPFTEQTYCEIAFAHSLDDDEELISKDTKQKEDDERLKLLQKKLLIHQKQKQRVENSLLLSSPQDEGNENDDDDENARKHNGEKEKVVQDAILVEARRQKLRLKQQQQRLKSIDQLQPKVLFEVRLWNDPQIQYDILTEGDPIQFRKNLFELRRNYHQSETSRGQKYFWSICLALLVGTFAFTASELYGRKVQRMKFVSAYLKKQQQGPLKSVIFSQMKDTSSPNQYGSKAQMVHEEMMMLRQRRN